MPLKAPDDRRAVEFVIVPDVVRERFVSARKNTASAGLTLVYPDPARDLDVPPAALFTEAAG
jgi:hypothetical protein